MAKNLLVFQRFNNPAPANHMAELLRESGIEFQLTNNHKILEPAYANNSLSVDISLQLKPEDFMRAHKALENAYAKDLNDVDKDYYLLTFTDDELMEIITRQDEWGYFDYQLARKLLKDKGKEITPEVAELLKSQRIKNLAEPETVHKYLIYLGYFSAIMGGVLGLIIGWAIAYYKKTLPNGKRVYAYRQQDRDHGTRMILMSICSITIWAVLNWFLANFRTA